MNLNGIEGKIKWKKYYDNIDNISWYSLSMNKKLDEDFIEEFQNLITWSGIGTNQQLSYDFMLKFKDKLSWSLLTYYQKNLPEAFIEIISNVHKYKYDAAFWEHVWHYQKVSESFIRKHTEHRNWFLISRYQKLSEDFIREYQNSFNWNFLKYQDVSDEFKKEFAWRLYRKKVK